MTGGVRIVEVVVVVASVNNGGVRGLEEGISVEVRGRHGADKIGTLV